VVHIMSNQAEFCQDIGLRGLPGLMCIEVSSAAFAEGCFSDKQGAHYFSGGQQGYPIEAFHSANLQSQQVLQSAPHGIYDAFFKTCQRWKIDGSEWAVLLGHDSEGFVAQQIAAGHILNWNKDTRDRAAYVVAISLGLGTLFNEDAEAENSWLRQTRSRLLGKTPLQHILEGSMKNLIEITELVLEERGLGFIA